MSKIIFKGPEHFYLKGKHVPVSPQEEKDLKLKENHSKTSLFFMGLLIITAFFYFAALMLDNIGFSYSSFAQPIIYLWFFANFAWLITVLKSRKVDSIVSGKAN